MPVQRVLTLQVPDIIFNVCSWFVLLAVCYIVDTRASSATTSTQVHGKFWLVPLHFEDQSCNRLTQSLIRAFCHVFIVYLIAAILIVFYIVNLKDIF